MRYFGWVRVGGTFLHGELLILWELLVPAFLEPYVLRGQYRMSFGIVTDLTLFFSSLLDAFVQYMPASLNCFNCMCVCTDRVACFGPYPLEVYG